MQWNITQDRFCFGIGEVACTTENLEPTKRNAVSVTAKFFDPLGVVSPVTILFKIYCQQLCEAKVGWDKPLTGSLLENWDHLLSVLRSAGDIVIPRCLLCDTAQPTSVRLVGFCDASTKAYAAIVYMKLEGETSVDVKFLAATTRVAPVGSTTSPRLEPLSALLLSKLISNVRAALENEILLDDPLCFTDSMATLYWIQGVRHEWKQFVEKRVTTIRSLVKEQHWRHCPGRENPADIPSRGMSASALVNTPLWLDGPDWLYKDGPTNDDTDITEVPTPDDCLHEMKRKEPAHSLVTLADDTPTTSGLSHLIPSEQYSSSHHLFRVTALVLKFIHCLRSRANNTLHA